MLALRGGGGDTMAAVMAAMEASSTEFSDEFPDFSAGGNLLDSIDFDDLFMGMQDDDVCCDDVLPDLEMDSDLLVGFELSGCEDEDVVSSGSDPYNNSNGNNDNKYELSGYNNSVDDVKKAEGNKVEVKAEEKKAKRKKVAAEEEVERGSSPESTTTTVNSSFKESEKGKKSSSHAKTVSTSSGSNNNNNSNQKRKAKVDWTPELHRRFVQAVEQLGVDKAVPSRILELMGIDCLTRHNIASHLQKYRSHRKHLLAREAEAASWTQKRQMYGVAVGGGGGGVGGGKGGGGAGGGGANISPTPWHHPPTMGFPPPMTPIQHHHPHSFRPLHVWGHPSLDLQSRMPMWPKQVVPSPSPPPPPSAWTPPPPHPPPLWHSSSHHRRFTAPPVPGIPPHAMYRPDHSGGGTPQPQPGLDALPTKESIDSALGDVLAKPWLPLPIGLKPPSVDSVLVELQRQGVPKIPPSSSSSS